MNSIVRIVLRGLLSGEIKAEPQVFECLKEISQRTPRRHSRVLRIIRPAGAPADPTDADPAGKTGLEERHSEQCDTLDEGDSSEDNPSPEQHLTLASTTCGRWVRVSLVPFVAGLLLMSGVAVGQAAADPGASATTIATSTDTRAAIITTLQTQVASALSGFMHFTVQPSGSLLIASGIVLVGMLCTAAVRWYCRNRLFVMRPYEIALQALEACRYRSDRGLESNPTGTVLAILRHYLEAQFRLDPVELGSRTRCGSLTRLGPGLTQEQRWLLQKVVAAEVDVAAPQFPELHEKASRFVWATACSGAGRKTTVIRG